MKYKHDILSNSVVIKYYEKKNFNIEILFFYILREARKVLGSWWWVFFLYIPCPQSRVEGMLEFLTSRVVFARKSYIFAVLWRSIFDIFHNCKILMGKTVKNRDKNENIYETTIQQNQFCYFVMIQII